MNAYQQAMDRCVPPEGMEKRLAQRVLSAQPEQRRPFRPGRGHKKTAALLLAAVLILATGAASVWDPLLVRRFGPQAALSYMGGAVFQEVNVTSVCDDVSLTVTQALCSDKSVYLLLEYKLPDGFQAEESWTSYPKQVGWYGTGNYTWEEFKALEGELWQNYDWSDYFSYMEYFHREDYLFAPYDIIFSCKGGTGSGSGSGTSKGYDPETNTLTWMLSHDFDTGWDLTVQPLTVLVSPPCVDNGDGTVTAVTDHPAIITFQPFYDGPQSLDGTLEEDGVRLTATLSPFALALETEGMGYPSYQAMIEDAILVARDGSPRPVLTLGLPGGGSAFGGVEGFPDSVSTTVHFAGIVDPSDYTALRVGDYTLSLG